MPEIEDDDFIREYEGAYFEYEQPYHKTLDRIIRFGHLPDENPEEWTLTNATANGGGLHRERIHPERLGLILEWIYPAGLAIEIEGLLLQGITDREFRIAARARLLSLLARWRRNRY